GLPDVHVTGVQTCALPISARRWRVPPRDIAAAKARASVTGPRPRGGAGTVPRPTARRGDSGTRPLTWGFVPNGTAKCPILSQTGDRKSAVKGKSAKIDLSE